MICWGEGRRRKEEGRRRGDSKQNSEVLVTKLGATPHGGPRPRFPAARGIRRPRACGASSSPAPATRLTRRAAAQGRRPKPCACMCTEVMATPRQGCHQVKAAGPAGGEAARGIALAPGARCAATHASGTVFRTKGTVANEAHARHKASTSVRTHCRVAAWNVRVCACVWGGAPMRAGRQRRRPQSAACAQPLQAPCHAGAPRPASRGSHHDAHEHAHDGRDAHGEQAVAHEAQ